MRHRKVGKKFHRVAGRRRSFFRNLVNDIVRSGRVETTEARAKALRPQVEKLITLAKKQTLAARRLVLARMGNAKTAAKLFEEIAPKYATRPGGFMRITKLGKARKRDAAATAVIEFV